MQNMSPVKKNVDCAIIFSISPSAIVCKPEKIAKSLYFFRYTIWDRKFIFAEGNILSGKLPILMNMASLKDISHPRICNIYLNLSEPIITLDTIDSTKLNISKFLLIVFITLIISKKLTFEESKINIINIIDNENMCFNILRFILAIVTEPSLLNPQ